MKRTDVERRLRKAGWVLLRHGGNHDVWENPEGDQVTVPRHSEINEYTAKGILRKANA